MSEETSTTAARPHRPLRATHEAFENAELPVRARNARLTIRTAVSLIPLGMITDHWLYPEHFTLFATVRLLCALLVALLLIPLRTPGPRALILLSHLGVLIPTVLIFWLIFQCGDPICPYHQGLSLLIVIAALILRWRFIDSLINALVIIIGYTVAAILIGGPLDHSLTALYFLCASAFFATLSCYLYNNLRHREFYLREEVEANRHTLITNNEELKALSEAQTRFFSNVSHELRTPLTLILAPIEHLASLPALQDIPAARSQLETLSENGFRLLRLINDLLEVSRLESGDTPSSPENIDLPEFALRTRRSLASIADTKEIVFTVTTDLPRHPIQVLHHDGLEKIITNLLINALKFTPNGGWVSLDIREDNRQLVFAVADNGIGLSEEELPHIFDRFWQADSPTSRKSRGVGIGLALAKNLAEKMDGRLTVTSSPGDGATFFLTLPISPARADLPSFRSNPDGPAQPNDPFEKLQRESLSHAILDRGPLHPPMPPAPSSVRSKPFTILIIDDEQSMRSYLATFFDQHRILLSSDGRQGLALAREHLPDLIILDYMMPGMDGIRITSLLRRSPPTSRIPILLLTAHGGDTPRIMALEAGVSDFLTKPFYSSELSARVHNLLLQQKYQADLRESNVNLSEALVQLQDQEEELVRSEKFASLGQMSAGIVHEINNPLNYANTSLHLLKTFRPHLPDDQLEDYDETLADLADALQRVIRIITDLRALTRGNEIAKLPVSLHQVVTNAARLLSPELGAITFTRSIPTDLRVLGNENQLCQVFVNLLQNAIHATAGEAEPTLDLGARNAPDGFVTIILSDNGHGIPDRIRHKIFDPFFTTKDIGQGTGLGLSLTLKIIHQHQGTLNLRPSTRKGSTFEIRLPSPDP